MISEVKLDVKPEEARLFLCKPNREIIAELKEAFNRHLSLNFGYLHELSFTVPSIILDNNNKFVPNSNFKKVRGDFLIKFQKGKDEDYFIITNPNKKSIGGKEVLEVQAIQLPYELKNKTIRDFEAESIRFYDPAGHDGLLNQTLLKLSNWQVDYVDSSLYNIERSFNESKKSLLEFVFEACEKFGDIVPVWDTVNKRVSFYLEENLGIDEGLSIEKGKYLINLEQDNSFDNVYTQITCLGQDGLSIDEINITGTSSLEDFSYYLYPFERDENKNVIQSSTYMSDSLCHALLDYQELLESKQGEFDNLLSTSTMFLRARSSLHKFGR